MNLKKVLTEIVKKWIDGKEDCLRISHYKDKIGVTVDGFILFVFDDFEFPFDYEKLTRDENEFDMRPFISASRVAVKLTKTNTLRKVRHGTCIKLKFEDDRQPVYVDERFIKYFNAECEFRGLDCKSLVSVYKDNELIGAIMPVRIQDGE